MKEVTRNRGRSQKNILDKVIEWTAPEKALRRSQARARMALVGGYSSGDRSRSSNKRWPTSSGSANAEILPSLDNLRSDCRDLMRNTPLALGAIKTVVTSVVGYGITPQARIDRAFLSEHLSLTEEQMNKIEEGFEREIYSWGKKKSCDAAMKVNFPAMQRLVLRSALESGDVFPLRRFIQRPGRRHSTAIQILEADRIDNPKGKSDTALLHAGVERDQYGAAVAYHVLKSHPGDRWTNKERFETERFPAFMDDGEWQMLHIMISERPEQTRGVPYLAPIVEILKQLSRYTEAEIMSAVISAMFTVFIKTENGEGLQDLDPDNTGSSDSKEMKLGNGMIIDLANGESVEFADPQRPNTGFDPFVLAILRQVGVALEIPFEILVKHFTASYSAAQAAIVEAWKFFRTMRTWLVDEFCQPCYEAVILESVARGYVDAPGFFAHPMIREAYLRAEWTGPPRGMIDQKKEAEANEIMEDRGWKTAQAITQELTGGDWDQNHVRRVKEEKMRAEAGFSHRKTQEPAFDDDDPDDDGDFENE